MEHFIQQLITPLPSYVLLILIGLCMVMLCKGADWSIEGVVALANRTGLPRIIIGATIVSLGTTLPEAFVSVTAAWTGNPGLALGNGVGSIIADTGLILGITIILSPVVINRYVLNRTAWAQVGAATLLVIISVHALVYMPDPMLMRWVGGLFVFLLVLYIYLIYRWSKYSYQGLPSESMDIAVHSSIGKCLGMVFGGLFLVILGARLLVPSAVEIAYRLQVPQDIIAATMIALGTSLPELMTAALSIRKGHPEIAVGNVIGADVLNCLFVIGAAALAKPLQIPSNFYYFHFPVMLLMLYSLRAYIWMSRSGKLDKKLGIWLLGLYLVYIFIQYALNL